TEFELPVPPLPEQRRIREKLDILYTKLNASRARLESVAGYQPQGRHSIIERLAQSLLAKAFRGELVPQDPNDEPASVLLEKIRAKRIATPTNSPRRPTNTPESARRSSDGSSSIRYSKAQR